MSTVTLDGLLVCANEAEAELVRVHLPEHILLTRAEPGCLSFEVSATRDPFTWWVEERFVDRAAFEQHQRRVAASVWGQATVAIQRRYTVTEQT